MKQNTFISTLALVAIAFLTACGSDEQSGWLITSAIWSMYLKDRSFPQRSLAFIALSGMVRPIMNCIILHKVHFMRKCILPMAYHID